MPPDRDGPMGWPADAPMPRGEGAGLSAPAAAAKQEQLAQHCRPLYQQGARAVKRAVHVGAGIFGSTILGPPTNWWRLDVAAALGELVLTDRSGASGSR